jgi:hypothetical protein
VNFRDLRTFQMHMDACARARAGSQLPQPSFFIGGKWRNVMNTRFLLFAASAVSLLATASAEAGSCSEQISELQKTLASKDAGMGPVSPGTAVPTAPTTTNVPKAGGVAGTEATPAMSEALKGKAASPADVQKQNLGQPTAAESAGAGSAAPATNLNDAMASLQRARELEKAGKEAECIAEIEKAKSQIGSK